VVCQFVRTVNPASPRAGAGIADLHAVPLDNSVAMNRLVSSEQHRETHLGQMCSSPNGLSVGPQKNTRSIEVTGLRRLLPVMAPHNESP
jgi:hypothetical protein